LFFSLRGAQNEFDAPVAFFLVGHKRITVAAQFLIYTGFQHLDC